MGKIQGNWRHASRISWIVPRTCWRIVRAIWVPIVWFPKRTKSLFNGIFRGCKSCLWIDTSLAFSFWIFALAFVWKKSLIEPFFRWACAKSTFPKASITFWKSQSLSFLVFLLTNKHHLVSTILIHALVSHQGTLFRFLLIHFCSFFSPWFFSSIFGSFGVDVSCSGFVEAGSMRFLGLLPMANSKGFLPLKVTCVSHRCSFAHQLVKRDLWQSGPVQTLGGCVHDCRKKLLKKLDTLFSSIWLRSIWSCRKSCHIVHSIECLHVMRFMEGHICTNRFRAHLESVHPLWKVSQTAETCIWHERCLPTLAEHPWRSTV